MWKSLWIPGYYPCLHDVISFKFLSCVYTVTSLDIAYVKSVFENVLCEAAEMLSCKAFMCTYFYSIQQTEPEIIEETNVDRVTEPRSYTRSRQAKGHSETSTLSSQPSIDEVRQQMHMLLEEAFSLASAGHGGQSRQEAYSSAPHLPYSEVVTSAPGTMTRPRAGVQWVPTYRPEMYQYSLPRPVSELLFSTL